MASMKQRLYFQQNTYFNKLSLIQIQVKKVLDFAIQGQMKEDYTKKRKFSNISKIGNSPRILILNKVILIQPIKNQLLLNQLILNKLLLNKIINKLILNKLLLNQLLLIKIKQLQIKKLNHLVKTRLLIFIRFLKLKLKVIKQILVVRITLLNH